MFYDDTKKSSDSVAVIILQSVLFRFALLILI